MLGTPLGSRDPLEAIPTNPWSHGAGDETKWVSKKVNATSSKRALKNKAGKVLESDGSFPFLTLSPSK